MASYEHNIIGVYLEVNRDLQEEIDIVADSCPSIHCSNYKKALWSRHCSNCGTKSQQLKVGTEKRFPLLWDALEEFEMHCDLLTQPGNLNHIYLPNIPISGLVDHVIADNENAVVDFDSIDIKQQISIVTNEPQIAEFIDKFKSRYGKDSIAVKYGYIKHYH